MIAIPSKFLIAGGVILALVLGVWLYGSYQFGQGWEERNTKARLELAARQTALYEAQTQLDNFIYEQDQKRQAAKAETDRVRAELASVSKRLQKLIDNGILNRPQSADTGPTAGTGPDWIGAFSACYSEYEMLGNDVAGPLDNLRALQGIVK